MALGLGIDAGGTATRWRLADADGAAQAEGTVDPLSGHIFSAAAETRARDIIADLAAAVGRQRPRGIVAGITGLDRDAPAVALLQGIFAETFGIDASRIFVAEDMWIAYLSYFALGEGILVYSGTGSIGYYLGADKQTIRIGGRGNLIDDGGSGFWIAREALKAVWRAEEDQPGSGWRTILGARLADAVGGTEWNDVRSYVYGGDRGKIGSLARSVGEAGAAGDATALAILRAAGGELARLATSLIRRVGARPVALVGGGSRVHPCIAESFRAALPARVEVITAEVDAALTAARLAASLR